MLNLEAWNYLLCEESGGVLALNERVYEREGWLKVYPRCILDTRILFKPKHKQAQLYPRYSTKVYL